MKKIYKMLGLSHLFHWLYSGITSKKLYLTLVVTHFINTFYL